MRTKHSSRKTRLFACVCLSVSVLLFATGFTPALPEVMPQDFGLGILIPGTPEEAMRILAQMDECTTENIYNTQLPLRLSNGRFFVFDAEGTGQSGTVSVTFSTIPVEGFPNGHTVTYGYRTGGVDVELGTTKLFNGCSIDFPMDGIDPDELYICNYSSDSIYLKSISAEVN